MKFLLDVHIATSIARALINRGHDVLRASDAHGDWSDRRLLELAVAEQRIVVTEDSDFTDLIYRDGVRPPSSILYLRSDATAQADLAERVLLVLENTNVDGHMVVIQKANVRHRPLPEKSNIDG